MFVKQNAVLIQDQVNALVAAAGDPKDCNMQKALQKVWKMGELFFRGPTQDISVANTLN